MSRYGSKLESESLLKAVKSFTGLTVPSHAKPRGDIPRAIGHFCRQRQPYAGLVAFPRMVANRHPRGDGGLGSSNCGERSRAAAGIASFPHAKAPVVPIFKPPVQTAVRDPSSVREEGAMPTF